MSEGSVSSGERRYRSSDRDDRELDSLTLEQEQEHEHEQEQEHEQKQKQEHEQEQKICIAKALRADSPDLSSELELTLHLVSSGRAADVRLHGGPSSSRTDDLSIGRE
ncbi:hypothetical protein PHYPO_G00208490 [Pangasianodon hypophthalmus]|uniref:Uncharacterized protein n=1 Tax=Pangasianodon hypophthalmus TaxID=310915 RepID=A0A5N5PCL1_PANHP|nr:hypothetical protein PHYPO_G00208490 [Pangasianodon hypophthalmus]